MQLEFDPAKAAANLAKHGVDFSTVLRVFEDPTYNHSKPKPQPGRAEVLRYRPRWTGDFNREVYNSRRCPSRDRCWILEEAK